MRKRWFKFTPKANKYINDLFEKYEGHCPRCIREEDISKVLEIAYQEGMIKTG